VEDLAVGPIRKEEQTRIRMVENYDNLADELTGKAG